MAMNDMPCPFCGNGYNVPFVGHDKDCYLRMLYEQTMIGKSAPILETSAAWNKRAGIVRCRDCSHFTKSTCGMTRNHTLQWCRRFRHVTNPDGFCAWPNGTEVR